MKRIPLLFCLFALSACAAGAPLRLPSSGPAAQGTCANPACAEAPDCGAPGDGFAWRCEHGRSCAAACAHD